MKNITDKYFKNILLYLWVVAVFVCWLPFIGGPVFYLIYPLLGAIHTLMCFFGTTYCGRNFTGEPLKRAHE